MDLIKKPPRSTKLAFMSYPYSYDESSLNIGQISKLVTWLEDTQIRHLPEEDRANLRSFEEGTSPKWWKHLQEYAKSLGYKKSIPYPLIQAEVVVMDSSLQMFLDWIVGKAIRFFYSDDGKAPVYNTAHQTYVKSNPPLRQLKSQEPSTASSSFPSASAAAAATDLQFKVEDMGSLQPLVQQMCQILSIIPTSDVASDLVTVARTVKQMQLFEQLQEKDAESAGGELITQKLAKFPTGYKSTGDDQLDQACRILRIMYTMDLRELQDHIDTTLIKLQNITGDPKTDARLGQVGR